MGERSRGARIVAATGVSVLGFTLAVGALLLAAGRPVAPPLASRWLAEPGVRVVLDASGAPVATVSSALVSIGGAVDGMPGDPIATAFLTALAASGIDAERAVVERTFTAIPLGPGEVSAGLSLSVADDAAVWESLSWDTGGGLLTYLPLREVLPAEPAVGRRWSGSGVTNGLSPYSITGEVTEAGSGCTTVTTTAEQEVPTGAALTTAMLTRWCQRRGQVAATDLATGSVVTTGSPASGGPPAAPPAADPLPGGTTAPPPLPGLGKSAVVALGGMFIGADGATGDLLAWRPGRTPALMWWHHPGGLVTGLGAGEGVIVAATSQRELLAFDALGQLRWVSPQPEVAVGPLTVAGGEVTGVLASGAGVAVDAATGQPRQQRRPVGAPTPHAPGPWQVPWAGGQLEVAVDGQVRGVG